MRRGVCDDLGINGGVGLLAEAKLVGFCLGPIHFFHFLNGVVALIMFQGLHRLRQTLRYMGESRRSNSRRLSLRLNRRGRSRLKRRSGRLRLGLLRRSRLVILLLALALLFTLAFLLTFLALLLGWSCGSSGIALNGLVVVLLLCLG